MRLSTFKPLALRLLGPRASAALHGVRFAWLGTRHGDPEPEFALLDDMLRLGDIAVDVGANGADWTLQMHRRVGREGHVYAFEADPYYAMATAAAIRYLRLRSVTLFPIGLSDREEELPLRVKARAGERHSGRGSIERAAQPGDDATVSIRLRPLDALLDEHPRLRRTALVKCDVEGFELFVFRGATRLLGEARPFVILEVGRSERQGYTPADLHRFFTERRYRAFALTGPRRLEATDEHLQHPAALGHNRTLVPEEKLERVASLRG